MSDFRELEDRYLKDAKFNLMVNNIYKQIENLNFSPNEVREAALFAAFKFEMFHTKPFIIPE